MEDLPAHMSLTALADRCMREIEKYRHKEPYNDQYCLEIFHRAMVKHDHGRLGTSTKALQPNRESMDAQSSSERCRMSPSN